MEDIVAGVRSESLARQVYAVSLLAVTVDTEAEKAYLKRLADNLGLDSAAIGDIYRQLDSAQA